MQYLPLFLEVRARPVLLVGAGEVAFRKLETLVRARAQVRIVAPQVSGAVTKLAAEHALPIAERPVALADLDDVWLVVAATGDPAVNQLLENACAERRIWLNVVDDTPACSAIFPSIVDRDPVLVAISTGGRSPTLARLVRGWVDERLPQRLSVIADFIGRQRPRVTAALAAVSARQQLWSQFLQRKPLRELIEEVEQGKADVQVDALLAQARDATAAQLPGQVALVGGGPGDPDLITVRGLNLLRQADVIFYDNLVNAQLLDYARRDAEKIYVGKKRAFKGIRQEAINELMVTHALQGQQVVRLKGGDPFIFGRGGEEIEQLAAHGIPFVVVPGISAALGGASYAGIPLTHRTVSQSVRFVTGHRATDRANLDWPELAKPGQTLVVYMGLPALSEILAQLIAHGRAPDTPAALIEKATLPAERLIEGTIANLAQRVAAAAVTGPTLIIIGEVVGYRVASPDSKESIDS